MAFRPKIFFNTTTFCVYPPKYFILTVFLHLCGTCVKGRGFLIRYDKNLGDAWDKKSLHKVSWDKNNRKWEWDFNLSNRGWDFGIWAGIRKKNLLGNGIRTLPSRPSDKTGTCHTDTQWKAKGGEGREQKPLNAPHIMLLLPVTLINKRYSPEHEEFHACAY